MKTLSSTLIPLFLLLSGDPSVSTADDDPGQILSQSAGRLKDVSRVRYRFSFRGTGSLAGDYVGSTEMEQIGDVGGSRIRVRIQDRNLEAGGIDMLATTDGEVVTLIDHSARRWQHGGLDGGGSSLLAIGLYGTLLEFIEASPMQGDLLDSSLSLEGMAEVKSRPCRQVRVLRPTADILWCFDTETLLPLRQIWTNKAPMPPGTMDFTLTEIELPDSFDSGRFRPAAPEGYTVEDVDKGPLALGTPAPDWTLTAADGRTLSLEELRGRLTVIIFWASWCSNCRRIMGDIESMTRDFSEHGVQVIGLSTWEQDETSSRQYIKNNGYTFQHILHGETIVADYLMTSLPGLYVLDPNGRFLLVRIGPAAADMAALRSLIRSATER